MNNINNIAFHELESEKYWSFPKNYKGDPKTTTRSMIFSGDYVGARKMDGAYYRFIKDKEGNMRLQGRSRGVNGSFLDKIDHVPHLLNFFNKVPNGTCLLGEIYFPDNEGSSNVTTIMGCTTEKAIARQQNGSKLHYYIFDIWAWDGISYLKTPCEKRFAQIKNNSEEFFDSYVEWAEYYEGAELWEQLEIILEHGGEGIVMTKKGTYPEPGKRPARKTLKVKKELANTIDCIFTGKAVAPTRMYSGKEIDSWQYWEDEITGQKIQGSYYKNYFNGETIIPVTKPYFFNWAGSLEIGVVRGNKVVPIGYLSGLTDEIKANYQKYKGMPIEVTCMEIQYHEDGRAPGLRHAKFVRFRPDLTIKDCTYEKVFEEDKG